MEKHCFWIEQLYTIILYIFFELMDLPEPAGITKGKQIISWSPEQ